MKVLLMKMSSLGDVVHALPALTDAARNGARFHWVVEEAFQAVPATHPAVEVVLPIAWRRWRRSLWRSRGEVKSFFERLAGERYDLAIDSQGLIKSALAMKRAAAREKVGFGRHSARESLAARLYDRCIEVPRHRHAVDRQRQLFAGALGYAWDPESAVDFGLNPKGFVSAPAASPERCVLLHGATWATKLWPEAMWIELAGMAAQAGLKVMLPWGNVEERARAERIAGASGSELLPNQSLEELMSELRRARVVVGVDSGLAHLAGALGVPTVVLYGSTSSRLTGCRGKGARNLQADFPCAPCLSRTCRYRGPARHWRETAVSPPCYGELDPARVWAAALETMDAHRLQHI